MALSFRPKKPTLHLTRAGHTAVRRVEGYEEPEATPVRVELRMRKRVSRAEIARTILMLRGLAAVRGVETVKAPGEPDMLAVAIHAEVTPDELLVVIDAAAHCTSATAVTITAQPVRLACEELVGAAGVAA